MRRRNWELHQVSKAECEQVFFNRPIRVAPDEKHSQREPRRAALGQTNAGADAQRGVHGTGDAGASDLGAGHESGRTEVV